MDTSRIDDLKRKIEDLRDQRTRIDYAIELHMAELYALEASREATILLNAPVLDRHLEAMAEFADRVFCFYDVHGAGLKQDRSIPEIARQTTWETFS